MINTNNSILHIIDAQERLFDVMHNKDFLRQNMTRFLKGIRILGIPVLWMEQYPKGLGPTIRDLREELKDQEPMEKMCFSSCGHPDFLMDLHLTGRRQVLIMGIEAHVCVYQTVRDLIANGFRVHIVADAVSSRTPENHQMALKIMESCGARLTTVEMALFELLEKSSTDEFRQISKLVK